MSASPNNSTPVDVSEQLARNALAQQSTASLLWIVFGLIGVLSNATILATIAKTKTLHNKSQFAIFSYALLETLWACSATITGCRRYVTYLLDQSGIVSQVGCTSWQLSLQMFSVVIPCAIAALGIDRFLAVATPAFYRSVSIKIYLIAFNTFCYSFSLIAVVAAFATVNFGAPNVIICNYVTAFSYGYQNVWGIVSQIFLFLAIGVYVSCLIKLGIGYWGVKKTNVEQRKAWAREVQLHAFVRIFIIFVAHLIFYGCNLGATNLVSWQIISTATASRVAPFLGFISFIENISHLVVYLCINQQFRKAFVTMIWCRSATEVVSLT